MPYQETHAASPGTVHAAMSAYCPPRQNPVIPTACGSTSRRPPTYAVAAARSARTRVSGSARIQRKTDGMSGRSGAPSRE
jgi:hypothetical protein